MTRAELKSLKMWENVNVHGRQYYVVSEFNQIGNINSVRLEDGESGKQVILKLCDCKNAEKLVNNI